MTEKAAAVRDSRDEPAAKRMKADAEADVSTSDVSLTQMVGSRPVGAAVTLTEISQDKLMQLAREAWSAEVLAGGKGEFKPELVQRIYREELGGTGSKAAGLRAVMLLEISQYLENYLWPNFDADSSSAEHVLSMLLMVNEKVREAVPAWACFASNQERFGGFFTRVIRLQKDRTLKMHERVSYLLFLIHAFQSLENELVRGHVIKLLSLPLWHSLSPGRQQVELAAHPELHSYWKTLAKKEKKLMKRQGDGYVPAAERPEAAFLPGLIDGFLQTLEEILPAGGGDAASNQQAGEEQEAEASGKANGGPRRSLERRHLQLCERFVEFLIDLLSQFRTRRFLLAVLEERAVLVKCKMSELYRHAQGHLFAQLVDLLQFYLAFPIDNQTAEPMGEEEVVQRHYDGIQQLQRLAFRHIPQLKELALSNCGSVEKPLQLAAFLKALSPDELRHLVTRQLRLVREDDPWSAQEGFLREVMLAQYQRRQFQTELINQMPLYPTEAVLWDESLIPTTHFTGQQALALPKLNLQFLTIQDYLLRNFNLFRLEATYEIREDILDVLRRLGATWDYDGNVVFQGWARMASAITSFKVIEVQKPHIGELKPSAATAELKLNLKPMRELIRREWDELKQHDVVFLLTVRPQEAAQQEEEEVEGTGASELVKLGLVSVRGAEVIEVKDEDGNLMNDFTGRVKRDEAKPPQGHERTIILALDTAQYQLDINRMQEAGSELPGDDVYATFNVVMRRKAKENNFKAVLESIRDLLNENCVVPEWLHDVLLGYGDPASAQYKHMKDCLQTVDFKDTFLDAEHVKESFPDYEMQFVNNSADSENLVPPFRVHFSPPLGQQEESVEGSGAGGATGDNGSESKKFLTVTSYTPPNPGPYPQDQPNRNRVRFTPVQTEAIVSGVQPGLTLVVGPPGTGKTDTAVQIMHVLYHNCPTQRTLLIAHSNQALNDLFNKILERDVPARYLLRLGMGEADLDSDQDFSRVGRVNAMLSRRIELLAQVERMAKQLGVAEEAAYTCETAGYFWLLHVLSRWEKFSAECARLTTADCVEKSFPFAEFFSDAPQPLFKGVSYDEDMEVARGCFRHLKTMFQELEECRAFELLKGQADRVNYLVTKHAKIVAMTCTHAALKRREFLQLGLKYDNLLMEESAQILEIETFIPMLLQQQQDGRSRLKRAILIGDHHQLPPVVKNLAFQKYSRMDQSLFTRFVRLGVPYVQLNAQGRARPALAQLYNWRYRDLGDLPVVKSGAEYKAANPGFAYEYQFVDVADFQGRGETQPVPFFFQNLGEAEYMVRCFMYMRMLGYPARRISMLTTYNGQRQLLEDVVARMEDQQPALGRPHRITTVDKYQGQQNDYILLSLVRTNMVGHLRDVRRLVVAVSRARLGLYIFGRMQLFGNCLELQPSFRQLQARPLQLALHPDEMYAACAPTPAERAAGQPGKHEPLMVQGLAHMNSLVHEMLPQWHAKLAAQADGGGGG